MISLCMEVFIINLHAFFISNTFISNTRLKLAKNYAKAKQHPEAGLLTSISKKQIACVHEIISLIVMKMKMIMEK